PDAGALRQLKIIKHVFDSCDRIIVGTDAGREGCLIFRYILCVAQNYVLLRVFSPNNSLISIN
ncbi:MAG: hypothetical protein LBE13_07475, partial [Bacteroidales bacterium]|nr:hypothetical protein [Bacteroidales bacterium]